VASKQSKARFTIELPEGSQSSLAAHPLLSLVDEARCHHTERGFRLPLGIYNVSVSRVCEKLIAFCTRLEKYIVACRDIDGADAQEDLRREVIDYIELAIYAAAEHVDDIEAIAAGFFRDDKAFKKDVAAKRLRDDIKQSKAFVSASANAIKHKQARIRMYSLAFSHGDISSILHGYFIEGVKNGVVGPSIVFHQTQRVFSITTLAWEILLFLLLCSDALRTFLETRAAFIHGPASQTSEMISKAVVSAARLPLFTFDEEHPFSRATFALLADETVQRELDSKLYGSFTRRWSSSDAAQFGKFRAGFAGDGVTRTFDFPRPSRVSLQHWT
jgi:hypothetical protein